MNRRAWIRPRFYRYRVADVVVARFRPGWNSYGNADGTRCRIGAVIVVDMREGKIVAPWTAETVQALNAYQAAGVMHPFTCARDSQHGAGYLLATEQGWVCTEDGCDYTQDWAHDFMTTEAARTPFWQRAEVLAEIAAPPSTASVAPQPKEAE